MLQHIPDAASCHSVWRTTFRYIATASLPKVKTSNSSFHIYTLSNLSSNTRREGTWLHRWERLRTQFTVVIMGPLPVRKVIWLCPAVKCDGAAVRVQHEKLRYLLWRWTSVTATCFGVMTSSNVHLPASDFQFEQSSLHNSQEQRTSPHTPSMSAKPTLFSNLINRKYKFRYVDKSFFSFG